MKKDSSPSLADYLVERRKIKQEFFTQINTLIDWRVISNIINKHYIKGESAVALQPMRKSFSLR